MAEGGIEAYRDALFPFAEVVTPNLREAAVLCDVDVDDVTHDRRRRATRAHILAMGPRTCSSRAGTFATSPHPERSPDVLVSATTSWSSTAPRVATNNDHGTGCSLSSAIAAGLALGRSVPDATRDAKSFVLAALDGAADWRLGEGRGPIDHLGWGE